jgi:hypothetical protein
VWACEIESAGGLGMIFDEAVQAHQQPVSTQFFLIATVYRLNTSETALKLRRRGNEAVSRGVSSGPGMSPGGRTEAVVVLI